MIMNARRNYILIVMIMLLGFTWFSVHPRFVYAADDSFFQTNSISYQGKQFTVQWVTVDLKSPYLRMLPVVAEEGIGHVEDFKDLLERNQALVGINGTFFDAFEEDDSKRYPNGLMLRSGEIVRTGENQTLAVRADKIPIIQKVAVSMKVQVKHKESTYTLEPWGVNTYYGDDVKGQVACYTHDFADAISFPNGTNIVIDNHKITQISENAVNIPEEGHVCFIGNTPGNKAYMLSHLFVGDEVSLERTIMSLPDKKMQNSSEWDGAIGVGPKLITNGEVDVDYKRDGFEDPRITSSANVRSFVGVDSQQRLVMGTVSTATVADMANVLLELGLTEAMNMDGGASSGLYYDGMLKRAPGRQLSNALIVKKFEQPQVQLVVNNQFVHEFRGFIQQGTTMAPFRGVFERIHAEFQWNDADRVLTAEKGTTKVVLRPDVATAVVNGKAVTLDVPPTIVDGHMFIPLRFIVETLGAKVAWDGNLYQATISIPGTVVQ